MSHDATAWVYRCSPYKGAAFVIHLTIADVVNDMHGDEFWMRQQVLADKTRTTRGTVNNALAQMQSDGLLALLQEGRGGANRYRFLMPERPAVFEAPHRQGVYGEPTPPPSGDARPDDRGARSARTRVSGERAGGARPARTEPKGIPTVNPTEPNLFAPDADAKPPNIAAAAMFTRFWEAYPAERRTAKGDARKAWAAAIGRAEPEVIIAGAVRYAEETRTWAPGEFARWGKTPGPWLRADMWEDEPGLHVRNGGRPAAGPRGPVGQHLGPAGRVTEL